MLITLALTAALIQEPAIQDYYSEAKALLAERMALEPNTNRAKNVILFVGDGMGVSTLTAARIFEAQQRGEDGESNELSFERFPYGALAKTYSHDYQVSDSAATASAMMTGHKTRSGMISTALDLPRNACGFGAEQSLPSLAEKAESAGKATGVISTARLTHATPATVYAHSPERGWEADSDLPDGLREAGCPDIAAQLIAWPFGDGLEIAMGGGRRNFIPEDMTDPEHEGQFGERLDGRDLTAEWAAREGGAYVWNADGFSALQPGGETKILGLFEPSHMQYEADRAGDPAGEPSLAEMTAFAIDHLAQDEDGYFLMVEGGRVDHAHHGVNAHRALTDAVALHEAVQAAANKVDLNETLIIVTADHSHTLTISGYPVRNNPILGLAANQIAPIRAADGKPYTTLGYANGSTAQPGEPRADLSDVDVQAKDFQQQTLIPSPSETHSGEDVAIYATGPWAHLFSGLVEQNYIYHVMHHALFPADEAEN